MSTLYMDEWAQSLYRSFGGPIDVAVELSKGPVVYALQKYDFFVIFPVNPSSPAKYHETFTHSGAKDDPGDAEFALDLILRHADRFMPQTLGLLCGRSPGPGTLFMYKYYNCMCILTIAGFDLRGGPSNNSCHSNTDARIIIEAWEEGA